MQAYVVLLYFTVYYFTLLGVKVATHTILYYVILTIYGIKYSMMKIESNSVMLYSTKLYYTLLYII